MTQPEACFSGETNNFPLWASGHTTPVLWGILMHVCWKTLSALLLLVAVNGLLTSCEKLEPTPEQMTFNEVATHPDVAFLSVGGNGPDDVWLVGARPSPQESGTVLRYDGNAWSELEVDTPHHLWWVHSFPDGPAFIGGAGATVLRVDENGVERTPTPPFFGNTVFGVWGASPNDVWAVGGFAGRAGFIWHWDGSRWIEAELPDDLPQAGSEIPSFLKVWGRSSDDVWVVGSLGVILHWNGSEWRTVESGTQAQLFTVFGNEDEVVAVGGTGNGIVLRGGVDGFVEDTPSVAPLLQGLTIDANGTIWIAGLGGYAARKDAGGDWETVDLGLSSQPQSVHALWSDGSGQIWSAGGAVLTPALNQGLVSTSAGSSTWRPPPEPEPEIASCPAELVDPVPEESIARRWQEQLLNSIRRDIPDPPVHARNMLHTSIAIYDAWAAYHDDHEGYVSDESVSGTQTDVKVTISHAAFRVLHHRYKDAVGGDVSVDCYRQFMGELGLDPDNETTVGKDPVATGNRIGDAVIRRYADDGANEANGYADTTGWEPINPPMIVDRPGTNVENPDVWQQLNLGTAETQNGIVLEESVQPYLGSHWGQVEPFAIERDSDTGLYGDPMGAFPSVDDPAMADWVLEVLARQTELGIDDGVMLEIGPAGMGNNTLGTNDGEGYAVNPVTGQPYESNKVPRGDFARVIAEFWADGPASETPPGHWLTLAHQVSDRLSDEELTPFGSDEPVSRLEWDIGLAFVVSAATHDAAINAWELKRASLSGRPIVFIRWMAENGQRSDPELPSFNPDGLPLEPGLVELITEESSAPGERHHHLRWYLGEVAVRAWPGEPGDRENEYTPIQWIRARDWIPYQRRTFVTPAFPGFTSGHSTFSRAAAEALTAYTGSPWFPGGLHEYVARQNEYLAFERGPSVELRLQWASYYDAADQAGQSRLWGGIHIWPDDQVGRVNGSKVGIEAADKARDVLGYAP